MNLVTFSNSSSNVMQGGTDGCSTGESEAISKISVEGKMAVSDQDVVLEKSHQDDPGSASDVAIVDIEFTPPTIAHAAPTHAPLGFAPANIERSKKARHLSPEAIQAHADKLVELAREGHFANGLIPVNAGADHFGVAISVFAQIFSMADRRGLRNIQGPPIFLDYDDIKQPKPAMTATIDPRGMLMIGKSTLEALSNDPPNTLNFKRGDSFNVSLRGEEIVLSRR